MTTDDWIEVQSTFDSLAKIHGSSVLMRISMCIRGALMRQIKTHEPFIEFFNAEIEKEFGKEKVQSEKKSNGPRQLL